MASLTIDGEELGVFGEVHPTVVATFDMAGQPVYLAEIALERLLAKARTTEQFVAISPMPAVKEDLALVVAEEVPSDEVGRLIREAGGELLAEVVLFDVYRGAQVGEAKKSLAYSLSFQSATKTLTGEETATSVRASSSAWKRRLARRSAPSRPPRTDRHRGPRAEICARPSCRWATEG